MLTNIGDTFDKPELANSAWSTNLVIGYRALSALSATRKCQTIELWFQCLPNVTISNKPEKYNISTLFGGIL